MTRPEGYRAPQVQANIDPLEFRRRLPDQVETCLRLTLERLQKNHRELTTHDIAALSQAATALYDMYVDLR